MTEALNVGLEVVLIAVVGAVGWLVHTVIRHGNTLTAITAQLNAHGEMDRRIIARLEAMDSKLDALHGDAQKTLERTEWLMRTADRHERFMETGRLDQGGAS
ncbi:MAG: hypothetical protein OXQ28_00595 [Acidobacteriota bacterium]|nr:hypothetical protein [Acidobacteriota bacterium]